MKSEIEIKFGKENVFVDRIKLLSVLSLLENKEAKNCNEEKIIKLMEKHKLFDKNFLKNINKI